MWRYDILVIDYVWNVDVFIVPAHRIVHKFRHWKNVQMVRLTADRLVVCVITASASK
jgi:hypothetical protein